MIIYMTKKLDCSVKICNLFNQCYPHIKTISCAHLHALWSRLLHTGGIGGVLHTGGIGGVLHIGGIGGVLHIGGVSGVLHTGGIGGVLHTGGIGGVGSIGGVLHIGSIGGVLHIGGIGRVLHIGGVSGVGSCTLAVLVGWGPAHWQCSCRKSGDGFPSEPMFRQSI